MSVTHHGGCVCLWDGPVPDLTGAQDMALASFYADMHISDVAAPVAHSSLCSESREAVNSFCHFRDWEEVHASGKINLPGACTSTLLGVSQIPTDSRLTAAQGAELDAVLSHYEQLGLFSSGPHDIGRVPAHLNVQHNIRTGNACPVASRPYQHSHREKEWLETKLGELLEQGVIRRYTGPWVFPVVLVKKPDAVGSDALRLCIDFRKLNSVTELDPLQMPLINESLQEMAGCKYYSSVDVVSAFWQIPMHEDSVNKTGFSTPFGNFAWVRMPFGLVNASATFQRFMSEHVLQGDKYLSVYLDNVDVASQTWEEHIRHLTTVLERCLVAGLKLKLSKCAFAGKAARCLGFVVDEKGIHTDPAKVEAILRLPVPRGVAEVRSFLGMMNFYAHMIPNVAGIARPLHHLTRKGVAFEWTPECHHAHAMLKELLASEPVIAKPNWDLPFTLTTDWSKQAVGAVLSQQDTFGKSRPVSFASRALTPYEQNYAATEGECLALVWAVNKFRPYVDGRHFTVFTDHAALQWLSSARFSNCKLERWALSLQEYSFTVEHVKGENNVVADCLSRLTAAPTMTTNTAQYWPQAATKQGELDKIPCGVCNDNKGYDNIVICDACNACYHLRCLMPPQSTAPTGRWLCPSCDPDFACGIHELFDEHPVPLYGPTDPYVQPGLLHYLLPDEPAQRRAVLHASDALRWHPTLDGWLQVRKKLRNGPERWLLCPPVEYRWNLIRLVHEMLCHSGVSQTLLHCHLHFHWGGIKADIMRYIQQCDACQRHRLILPDLSELQEPALYGPFEHVHVDLAGPFMCSTAGTPAI